MGSLWLLQAKIFPAPSAWAPMSGPGSDVTCSRGLPDPHLKQLPHRPAALNHIAGLFGFTGTVAGCALPADFLADGFSLRLGGQPHESRSFDLSRRPPSNASAPRRFPRMTAEAQSAWAIRHGPQQQRVRAAGRQRDQVHGQRGTCLPEQEARRQRKAKQVTT